jgi:hypothetical protein
MDKEKAIIHPISMLETIAMLIDKQFEHADEQYELLYKAKSKPHVLDNETVDRSIRLYEDEKKYLEIFNNQLSVWRKEKLNTYQENELTRLENQMAKNEKIVNSTLNLAKELRKGTIDEILEMDEIELAIKFFKDMQDDKI